MENVLHGIEDVDVYKDNIGAFSDNREGHIKIIDEILCRVRENGFTINPLKCEIGSQRNWL
eukprot:15065826-Ditylum_brightwellii.AAC.1